MEPLTATGGSRLRCSIAWDEFQKRPFPEQYARASWGLGFSTDYARVRHGVFEELRLTNEKTTLQSKNPAGYTLQGGGALEYSKQAVYPLPKSWRAFHRAEGEGSSWNGTRYNTLQFVRTRLGERGLMTVWQLLKACFWFVVATGAGFALLFYGANFSETQSLILAAVLTCLSHFAIRGYRLGLEAREAHPPFEPLRVRILPVWRLICEDFGLYDMTKWEDLAAKCDTNSNLRKSIDFTWLSTALFFDDARKEFYGDLDRVVLIKELERPSRVSVGTTFEPRLYISDRLAGPDKNIPVIEFGLMTEESLARSLHSQHEDSIVVIASLPKTIFAGATQPLATWDQREKLEELTKGLLQEFGWTEQSQLDLDHHRTLKHKYFLIHFGEL